MSVEGAIRIYFVERILNLSRVFVKSSGQKRSGVVSFVTKVIE